MSWFNTWLRKLFQELALRGIKYHASNAQISNCYTCLWHKTAFLFYFKMYAIYVQSNFTAFTIKTPAWIIYTERCQQSKKILSFSDAQVYIAKVHHDVNVARICCSCTIVVLQTKVLCAMPSIFSNFSSLLIALLFKTCRCLKKWRNCDKESLKSAVKLNEQKLS